MLFVEAPAPASHSRAECRAFPHCDEHKPASPTWKCAHAPCVADAMSVGRVCVECRSASLADGSPATAAMPEGGVNSAPTPVFATCCQCNNDFPEEPSVPAYCPTCQHARCERCASDPAAENPTHTGAMVEPDCRRHSSSYPCPWCAGESEASAKQQQARDDAMWNAGRDAAAKAIARDVDEDDEALCGVCMIEALRRVRALRRGEQ